MGIVSDYLCHAVVGGRRAAAAAAAVGRWLRRLPAYSLQNIFEPI